MKTWILVCDASHARVFETPGTIQSISLVQEHQHEKSREKGSDLIADRAGSTGSSGGVHGGIPYGTPPKEVEANNFGRQVAQVLNKGHASNSFTRLILVAPPHFLGIIRDNLNSPVRKLVTLTLGKNFTQLAQRELVQSLEKYM